MEKGDFVNTLKNYKKNITDLQKICTKTTGQQIQAKETLGKLESLATNWFENIEPVLRSTFHFENEEITSFRELFGKILELSGGRPSKSIVISILESISNSYHVKILVPVQKHEILYAKFPSLESILTNASGLEIEYLTEAVECANFGKKRAAVILGWCAAINRFHLHIEKDGFTKFNQASVQMFNIQSGRYKRFNKKFDIQNLSDLRMTVFDNDLLWVLEFLGLIDSNQHEKLEICFTMRNTSAHPGEANITDENLLSFFSDINSLIFANPKFALSTNINPP